MKRYWLMKSEPDVFSIDHLRRAPAMTNGWDGVRNYQARNFMKEMRVGDQSFFYHSSTEPPGIAGIVEIVKAAYPDPTQFEPKSDHYDPKAKGDAPIWYQVDVRFVKTFKKFLPLDELRSLPQLENMMLFKRSRLSVQPVAEAEWAAIVKRANAA